MLIIHSPAKTHFHLRKYFSGKAWFTLNLCITIACLFFGVVKDLQTLKRKSLQHPLSNVDKNDYPHFTDEDILI